MNTITKQGVIYTRVSSLKQVTEDQKVFQSISSSWENTDEHGSKLFIFTLVFVALTLIVALILSSTIPQGFIQTSMLALSEYILVLPLGYIYFTLYKSLKVN